ncbi:MAG TPA: type II CAAX endopeptidase family protein [Rhizomicrobium sp.]|jgi:membrane protease YdiL (CAAX protease family)|nr:type II CAAX endopeptidase family protein [Rhizomicrobium sp.]
MTQRVLYAADTAKGWMPWGILVPFLTIFFVVLTGLGPEIALEKAGLLGADDNPNGLAGFILFLTIPFGLLGLVVLGWIRFVERRSFASGGLTADRSLSRFLVGHLTGVGMASAIVAGIWLAGGLQAGSIAPAFQSPTALAGIALLCVSFALQSSAEEFVFRGWALSAIAPRLGIVLAIILSTAVFTLLHFEHGAASLVYVNTVLFALFACTWAIRRGHIWGVMGWHSGWNWILAVGFESRVTGLDAHLPALFVKMIGTGPDHLTGAADGPEGSIVCTAVLLAGIAWFALRRASSKVPQP